VSIRARRGFLFDPGVNVVEVYSLSRSLRRASSSEAVNKQVPQFIINLNNGWRQFEGAKGRRLGMSMMAHYKEIRLSIPTLWRYSGSF
jgi:hypothetical protein